MSSRLETAPAEAIRLGMYEIKYSGVETLTLTPYSYNCGGMDFFFFFFFFLPLQSLRMDRSLRFYCISTTTIDECRPGEQINLMG